MFPINNHPNLSPRSDNASFRKQFKITFWVFCIDPNLISLRAIA